MRILIVDDNPLDLLVTRQLILHDGVEVSSTSDVKDALQMLEEQAFDLVITDFDMHPYTGRVILERARALQPGIPVWCVSGSVDVINETEFFTGFNEVFTKPLQYDAFRNFFLNYLDLELSA